MKKHLILIISLLLVLSLCGCGANTVQESAIGANSPASTMVVSQLPTAESTPENIKVKYVETAAYVSAAITENGDLYTWGNDQAVPEKVMSSVSSVSINGFMTFSGSMMPYGYYLALRESGDVYAWGKSDSGIFGDEDYADQKTPVKIMDHVKQIDAGFNHALAITDNGDLYVWGNNTFGQIGNGTNGLDNVLEPVKIMSNVKQASAGCGHTMAVTENGELYGWGANNFGQLGNGEYNKELYSILNIILFGEPYENILSEKTPIKIMDNVQYVSAENAITCAVTNDGSLYSWGNNEMGLIGNGEKGDGDYATIDAVIPAPEKILENIKTVSVSSIVNTATDETGNLYAWGNNEWGAVGNGEYGDGDRETKDALVLIPVKIMGDVIQASACTHVLAINKNGELCAWGNNEYGQLGNGEKWDGDPNSAVLFEANPVLIHLAQEMNQIQAMNPKYKIQILFHKYWPSRPILQLTDKLLTGLR